MSDISNSWISYSRKTLSKQFYNAGCCTTVSHVFTELKTLKFEEHMIKTENRFICKCLFYSASLQNKIKGTNVGMFVDICITDHKSIRLDALSSTQYAY